MYFEVDRTPLYALAFNLFIIFLFILFGGILFAIFFKFIKLPSKFIEKAIGLGCVVGLLSGIYFVSM